MNIIVTDSSSTSLSVSWDSVLPVYQNGIISEYDVEYSQSTFEPHLNLTDKVNGANMSVVLTGLEEYVSYTVRVRAYTVIGAGRFSSIVNKFTLEDGKLTEKHFSILLICVVSCFAAPSGYPTNVVANSESPNEVTLQWDQVVEREQNGIITGYEIEYNQSSIDRLLQSGTLTVMAEQTTRVVRPLQPFIPYTLHIKAFTSIGAGPFSPIIITMTNPSGTGNASTKSCLFTVFLMQVCRYLLPVKLWKLKKETIWIYPVHHHLTQSD